MPRRKRIDMNEMAMSEVRSIVNEGLGVDLTFIDDNVMILVGLAQRAVLAGLASDCQPDMQKRLSEAAEKHRAAHESALGRSIP